MKLQPNFSWQKYEGAEETQREQFQYQLQSQHIVVANSVNATIDDESYWTRERQTAFTWTDGRAIWTKTITGTIVGTATTSYAHNISGMRTLVQICGTAQDATPFVTAAIPIPYVDPTTLANGIGVKVTQTNVVIIAGNNAWNGYTFQVTIYYTKG